MLISMSSAACPEKRRLAEEIAKDVMNVLNYGEGSVSVAIEEVPAQEWAENVYTPDIPNNAEKKALKRWLQRSQRKG